MARRLSGSDKLRSLVKIALGGSAFCAGVLLYRGDEKFYENVAMPLTRMLDPEWSHQLAIIATKWGVVPKQQIVDPPRLGVKLVGLEFSNPLGMAAGFDKQAEAVVGLTNMGFGFVEIGTVTPLAQTGNPKPRVFRLIEDRAIVNRYGFNSEGHEAVRRRLEQVKSDSNFKGIVGVNLGKNKESSDAAADYVQGLKAFHDLADYFVINISSPNTPNLRDLQSKENLIKLFGQINRARHSLGRNPPLFLKLAPDLNESQRKDIADVVTSGEFKIDGLIISNTTIARENLTSPSKEEAGGLSGAPLSASSTLMIKDMYKKTKGQIPIIGAGGVFSGQDAYEKIRAGASLVQIYTSYAYHGPPIVTRIKRELNALLESDNCNSVQDAVGKDT